MAEPVGWSGTRNFGSPRPLIRNLLLRSGHSYEIRFIGPAVRFYKYFFAGKFAIVDDPKNNPLHTKYALDPVPRYVANVLLRRNACEFLAGENYFVEFSEAVYDSVCSIGIARALDPGGPNGCNYRIDISGKGPQTSIAVAGLKSSVLTKKEKEYLRLNIYDLVRLFKGASPEKIRRQFEIEG